MARGPNPPITRTSPMMNAHRGPSEGAGSEEGDAEGVGTILAALEELAAYEYTQHSLEEKRQCVQQAIKQLELIVLQHTLTVASLVPLLQDDHLSKEELRQAMNHVRRAREARAQIEAIQGRYEDLLGKTDHAAG